jgi:hypothetical protein
LFWILKDNSLAHIRSFLWCHAPGTRRKTCPPAGGIEHGFLSGGVYAEPEAIQIIIKIFTLAVENLTGRSISSLGGSYMQSNGGNMTIGDKVILSAAIGGTAEALGGGKFSNGAVTGAFVYLLNHASQHGDGPFKDDPTEPTFRFTIKFKYGLGIGSNNSTVGYNFGLNWTIFATDFISFTLDDANGISFLPFDQYSSVDYGDNIFNIGGKVSYWNKSYDISSQVGLLNYNHNSKSGSQFLINLGHSKSFLGIFGTEYKLQLNTNRVLNYLIKNEMEYREAFKYNYRSFIH